jgi:glycosyltransferase involved in cell wall biosynthesis
VRSRLKGKIINGAKASDSVSIVIAAHNGGVALQACLASLALQRAEFSECIVVNDASTDDSIEHARKFGAHVINLPARKGPANARNLGALAATGSILIFLDADVCVLNDTISQIRQRFEADPELGAVFGSYDANPAAVGLPSQFRNLLHCFVHQTSNRRASTFWAGCGAIRREIFLKSQGFDVSYSIPSVEDIEFGTRLVRDGVHIALDPSIQVKHLKHWSLRGMILNDIRQRGIPWMRLILASHKMPNDLNLRLSDRISVLIVALISIILSVSAARLIGGSVRDLLGPTLAVPLLILSVVAINHRFYRFLASTRNIRFSIASVPLHLIYFLCCGTALVFGIGLHYWFALAPRTKRSTAFAGQSGD